MNHRILFVDDEEKIQKGLQRLFRSMRHQWTMTFVGGGRQALDALAASPFDIIISDLSMPDMDGIDLLSRVKADYPHMVRIVLSGHADPQAIMQTTRLAHQYLAKPSDTNTLKTVIARACTFSKLLADPDLRRQIAGMDIMPGLPDLYTRVMAALDDPECSIHRVGEIIAQDIGMTVKILQLVNSAFFGIARHVASPAEAAVFLGMDIIRALVLTIGIFAQFDKSGIPDAVLKNVYAHCMQTGILAREIALSVGMAQKTVDDAFMAGLLHDLGKLILVANLPATDRERLAALLDTDAGHHATEMEIRGIHPNLIGAYLIALWGLPHPIVEAVAFHHRPSQCPSMDFDVLGAVHVASVLSHHPEGHTTDDSPVDGIDTVYLKEVGMLTRLNEWRALAVEHA
ncbi:Response regulator receiver modulated metal dependent phosphohydrolase [Desulfosarcina cetonica]|uniref:response regulator n=1 Tax=Desulfosarcina cetonica TaxID=90730 RepID=UPI0006D12D46|nr:response regulator [Desulfosarcina cetonica]VTR66498.1 Response regulator receiver modulated metal dependent phosphohydrolase [Desulfosarcina cetonica]